MSTTICYLNIFINRDKCVRVESIVNKGHRFRYIVRICGNADQDLGMYPDENFVLFILLIRFYYTL